jgi:hypothetical protein
MRFAIVELKRNEQCPAWLDHSLVARSRWQIRLPTHKRVCLLQHRRWKALNPLWSAERPEHPRNRQRKMTFAAH